MHANRSVKIRILVDRLEIFVSLSHYEQAYL